MCRYAVYGPYKTHFACFECRKAFKRALAEQPAPCPDCGEPMAEMGLDFKAPPRDDVQHWRVVASLYRAGFDYRSCGCSGPGYRPSRIKDLAPFLERERPKSEGERLAEAFAARS